ncbi:sporulation YhaL family protein [Bacillus manliponensis]|uniref:SigE-dependent sporulation protein n=1 Tax=Bacillus manliponensis TaxID=574376 RepID=A0A073KCR6_9BACI|nr:sporulation YhaL family protein [Bacillus manliponensis]KEK20093.1 SigE-dependent sporulation protein [Bacillus manliponensis]
MGVEFLPWWIYLVIIGIIISGYMVLYTSKQEQEIDNEFIEKEGEVYMKRLQEEKERRQQEKDDHSVLL